MEVVFRGGNMRAGVLFIKFLVGFTILLALLTTLICVPAYFEGFGYGGGMVVRVCDDGVVQVFISLTLGEGLHRVELPIEPIVPTIVARVDSRLVPMAYSNGSVYLVIDTLSNVTIEYVANVTFANGVFQLDIISEDVVEVIFPSTTILLTWPEDRVLDARINQESLIIYLKGPLILKYILRVTTTQTPTPSTSPQAAVPLPEAWIALATVASIVVITAVLITLKTRKKGLESLLGEVDRAIIKALETRGGSAFQAELQNDIKLPKTTLWRHVKKLEKLGIVKIEKVGTQNKVILVKKAKTS